MSEGATPRTAVHGIGPTLVLVVALALALRLAGLHYSLWNDEVASTQFAAAPVHLLWSNWMVRETNPPLYYTLLHGWIALFGDADATLRLMSVLFGCIGVAAVYLLGRRAGGARAGLLSALLVALSAQHVMYSQQVRGYVLGHAAAVAAILAVVVFLAPDAPQRRGRLLLGYAAACTVALYAHTTFFLLPAVLNAYVLPLLAMRRQWRAAGAWIAANAAVLLLWAWWAHLTLVQAGTRRTIGWIGPPSLPYAVRMTMESYLPWQLGPVQFAVALVMVAAAGTAARRWRRRAELLLLPFLAIATPALLFVLSQRVPMFLDRTVYWSSAPFLVTVAAGLAGLRPRPLMIAGVAAAVLATAAGWLVWYPTREIEPWRAIVASIERQAPGAAVLVSGKQPALDLLRYCRAPRCSLSIVGLPSAQADAWASGFAVPGMISPDAANRLLARSGRLVAVRWMGQDPARVVRPRLRPVPLALPVGDRTSVEAALWRAAGDPAAR
ncbi:glycosyltransferase family 39 protein [Sphingomonas sp.]|uniref:glycosyltransferase family 39 protein n=1 Tax=Sphingomonas sp. TaxID=28214 RepID=UPI003CC5538B